MSHIPVFLKETVQILRPSPSKIFADFTFGLGGHAKSLLSCGGRVIGCDRDINAYKHARILEAQTQNFKAKHVRFSDLHDHLPSLDGILMDIGVSSVQIDQADRGFSFMRDGPLSMQMGINSFSAADIVNQWDENDIADTLYLYADEVRSRSIAKRIVEARQNKKITTTLELANIISRGKKGKIHPATKTFQALRIATNSELDELCIGLQIASSKLKIGGKLVVISFHSTEDKIIKNFFRNSRFLMKKPQPVFPSSEEVKSNVRSRSAKLRWGIKI
ncbi:16S rRNA (cytosine(1402)-N(4))-methyltransferase RsmH [Candidatus Cytomitobacter indipagum]|uniref:Ribosomal RNA small subunit methyltransferase H n=1 Tax=Candidatus Cytomitobacter indipagum TaxID=2601575 RepID=A0A5C0UDK6_9PROT|nr:16S rRNA (cytosine(1402)-N(4))-methyltransferase RsmH [Candidatus Cytomitobacter indipagum]QEK38116.1 16S rRNA (cytosine(1402)-N(4))-methyltransferase RsmH [Candidatus Cytomitobacter indipagum]